MADQWDKPTALQLENTLGDLWEMMLEGKLAAEKVHVMVALLDAVLGNVLVEKLVPVLVAWMVSHMEPVMVVQQAFDEETQMVAYQVVLKVGWMGDFGLVASQVEHLVHGMVALMVEKERSLDQPRVGKTELNSVVKMVVKKQILRLLRNTCSNFETLYYYH